MEILGYLHAEESYQNSLTNPDVAEAAANCSGLWRALSLVPLSLVLAGPAQAQTAAPRCASDASCRAAQALQANRSTGSGTDSGGGSGGGGPSSPFSFLSNCQGFLSGRGTGNSTSTARAVPRDVPTQAGNQTAQSRAEVVALQTNLRRLGYYLAPIDGLYGSATEAAVFAFQRDNNLAASGTAGPTTQAQIANAVARLNAQTATPVPVVVNPVVQPVVLQPVATQTSVVQAGQRQLVAPAATITSRLALNDQGAEVANLQLRLSRQDFYRGDVDGIFGPGTLRAVLEAQRFYGLHVDGVAGTETISVL
ncbi:peptidoglycan-binding protein [Leptolyngbya sp. FACHB-261]|uniref:peptidoglycan-binding domain-containing protein n=1 Tax=Leptolyngbya sp. FACHB-261 TaxID=2692806 RepID=UPI0016892E81|nr:peptidoglycan-binding domain-containing protein [Leptolyngbya sp. FACHB-261]MBD2102783.1 peptidoglycan-binding protein [Leptolyngbya sp. FACHB-261]